MSNDSKTFGEQYASAAGATDLTLDNNRQGHIDRVAAMGCAANRHSAGHRLARAVTKSRVDIAKARRSCREMALKASAASGRAGKSDSEKGEIESCADKALALFIDPACKRCDGTGRVDHKACKRCNGSGQEPMPRKNGQFVAEILDRLNAAHGGLMADARKRVR